MWSGEFSLSHVDHRNFKYILFAKLTENIIVTGMKERNDSSGDDDSDDDTDDPSLQSPQSPTEVCPGFSSFIKVLKGVYFGYG